MLRGNRVIQRNRSLLQVDAFLRLLEMRFRTVSLARLPLAKRNAISTKKINWNLTTNNTHNRHLRALYGFVIQQGYATQNPFNSVPFAKDGNGNVGDKIISVTDVKRLLPYSLDCGYKAECASLVLVFFCRVRVEEVSRINWNHRRVNRIPPNAVHWLRLCRTEGSVALANYEKRMQRLRRKAKITYPQNSGRHCFSSYHVALNGDAAQTALMLGHPNPALLYRTYRELVTFEEAEKFWNIVPDYVSRHQAELEEQRRIFEKAELLKRDAAEKEEAEMQSNVGKAMEGEDGRWHPVMDETVDSYAYFEM
jgi:hypothetical protein